MIVAQSQPVAAPSSDERSRLAQMVTRLFDHWQLPTQDRLSLLGLAEGNRAALSRYASGTPLGNSRDLLDRVGILLGIHKSLRLLFPENRDLAYAWMTQPNKAFQAMTPVQTVRNFGFAGLLMIRAYLDRARGH